MNLFSELKRRNVFRVALFYLVSAWVVVQVAETVLPVFDVPDIFVRGIIILLALGFVPALVFAWAFELTPDGLKRDKEANVDPLTKRQTASKLNWATLIVAVVAIGVVVADRMLPENAPPGATASESSVTSVGKIDKSIAVLPFSDFSPDGNSQWFADGLSEEILNSLVRVPDLLVAARTSSFSFRDSSRPIPEIAAELGVAHVLEGSVRMGGDRVRVTAQLIRAGDGFHVWSDTFDRDLADMIGIQEDLARRIAEAMKTTMDPEALAKMAEVGTRSVEAYQAYIRGRAIEQFGGNPDAYELFEAARSLDPDFAEAHYRAARFWQVQANPSRTDIVDTGLAPDEIADRFDERISAAITRTSNDEERLLYRATQAQFQLRFRAALSLFEAYVAQRPGDTDAWVALTELADTIGNNAVVLRGMRAVEPLAASGPALAELLPAVAYRLNDPAQARAEVERALLLAERWPQAGALQYQLHRALLWIGKVEEARCIHDWIFRADLDVPNPALIRLRQACAEGRLDEAQAVFETQISKENQNERWLALLLMGRTEAAAELLRPLEEAGNTYALASYLIYPQFDPRPYPGLMRILASEGMEPRALRPIPFACSPEGDGQ
ncbi:MAG: hypothetical protein GW900_05080 [Gammaproteobacteria bacterium]|nr:hypothetical protein [Gammaproteobacteria bacterium]